MAPTVGVEEEFHLADPVSRQTSGAAPRVMAAIPGGSSLKGQFETEIHSSMVEVHTTVCRSLADVRSQLDDLRTALVTAAGAVGHRVAAAGTLPILGIKDPEVVRDERYIQIQSLHGGIVGEMSTCGTHVHVGMPDRNRAVRVMTRARRWVPALLALSAGSPFWDGRDTGFASYRTVLWGRWPSATMTEPFETVEQYDTVVAALIESGAVLDTGQIYWDIRLSANHPTLEFRVADSALTVDDAVLQAGLCRAIARQGEMDDESGMPMPSYRPELLRAAKWRAARYGLADNLLDLDSRRQVSAATEVRSLVAHVRPALQEAGDLEEITALSETVLVRGDSAHLQRASFRVRSAWADVVDMIVEATDPARH